MVICIEWCVNLLHDSWGLRLFTIAALPLGMMSSLLSAGLRWPLAWVTRFCRNDRALHERTTAKMVPHQDGAAMCKRGAVRR